MDKRHQEMSAMLYDFIDQSVLFENRVVKRDRSRINVPFSLRRRELEQSFLEFTHARGIRNLRGNMALGLRASMYNAMPTEGAKALIEYLREFERARA